MFTLRTIVGRSLSHRVAALLLAIVPLLAAMAHGQAAVMAPPSLGVLPPVTVELRVRVPREGCWQTPQGGLVFLDSVLVEADLGPLPRAAAEPGPGEFAVQPAGVLRFSTKEAGRRVRVRYQYAPRRVALLETEAVTRDPESAGPLYQALTKELTARRFVVLRAKEVADAAAEADLGRVAAATPLPPDKLARLSRRLNAAHLFLPDVSVWPFTNGPSTNVVPKPREAAGAEHPRDPFDRTPPALRTSVEHGFAGQVRLVAVDGVTGAVARDQSRSTEQTYSTGRPAAAQTTLVRDLAREVVAAWQDALPPS
jgi:hypothetical protein